MHTIMPTIDDRPSCAHAVHEAPFAMWGPLLVLVAGAIGSGIGLHRYFVGEGREAFWHGTLFESGGEILHTSA